MKTMNVKTNDGSQAAIEQARLNKFKAGFHGPLLTAKDEGYEQARQIWNGIFNRKPAIIARCVGTSDVISAVNFARDNQLLTAVKGGGHNSAGTGTCDGGLMIDLSLMRRVTVDGRKKTARVEGGALLSDVDKETHQQGLAVSSGIVSHTGVGGLALGGGFGWISRKHGLSVDNLISAEIITANGKHVRTSADENPDLFWGIRGGGGNFGVVTDFEFKCARIGKDIFSGLIVKQFDDADKYIDFHRDYVRDLPDEMTVWMVLRHAPPLPFLPDDVHGKMAVVVPFVWLGEQKQGEKLIKPIRDITVSHGEAFGMNPWVNWQSGFDGLVAHGARNYWKSHHLKDLSDGCIEKIIEFAGRLPTAECEVFIPHMEGAPGRVAQEQTAFVHRATPFVLNIHTRWQEASDDRRCFEWAKAFHEATQPHAKGVYVNFLSDGENRAKDAYTPEAWQRLVEIKRSWDPQNLFRINQNINP